MSWVTNQNMGPVLFSTTTASWREENLAWQSKTHCVLAARLKNHLWQSPCIRDTRLGLFGQITAKQRGAVMAIDRERTGQKGIEGGGGRECDLCDSRI